MQKMPCSAPSTAVTQGRHGGRNGHLTAVTQIFYNTCVTIQKGEIWRSKGVVSLTHPLVGPPIS